MVLDIAVPDSPDLSNRGMPREFEWQDETLGSEDFHREDLETLLEAGAWTDGFEEWNEFTDLDRAHVRVVNDLSLFQALDFYWDPTEDRLRYDAPTLPDDWRERPTTESLDSSTVSLIENELDDLGRAVRAVLADYVEKNEDAFDHGWSDESYGNREN